jgi:primosomal protein N''
MSPEQILIKAFVDSDTVEESMEACFREERKSTIGRMRNAVKNGNLSQAQYLEGRLSMMDDVIKLMRDFSGS